MENNHLVEFKAIAQIESFDTDVLIAALQGEVNILRWMHDELADRGYSAKTGQYVGDSEAYDEVQERWSVID